MCLIGENDACSCLSLPRADALMLLLSDRGFEAALGLRPDHHPTCVCVCLCIISHVYVLTVDLRLR